MAKIKARVHPLFYLFGLYFAFTGKVFSFISFTLVAVCHELAHAAVAEKLGYRLNRITLMPYGCIVKGETDCFSYRDEIKIALAGPLINLLTAFLFIALWWFLPETYPYTELAVLASLTVGLINLLPCFPLDGGRILLAGLCLRLERKKALIVCRILGIALGCVFFGFFIYSIIVKTVNFTLAFFAAFMIFGNVKVSKENDYVRIKCSFSQSEAERGKEVKIYVVGVKTPVKRLFSHIGELCELRIVKNGKVIKSVSVNGVMRLKNEGKIYESIYKESLRLSV